MARDLPRLCMAPTLSLSVRSSTTLATDLLTAKQHGIYLFLQQLIMPASTYAAPRHFMSIQAEEEALLFYRTWSKIGKAKQRASCVDFIPDDDLSRSVGHRLEDALQDRDSRQSLISWSEGLHRRFVGGCVIEPRLTESL